MLKKLRLKIADWLVGDDTVLFASKESNRILEEARYVDLPDDVLAAASRRWFHAIASVLKERADESKIPVSVYTTQQAVLSLAKHLKDANADTGSFFVMGTVDGGATQEDFEVVVYRRPHDPEAWDDSAPPVETVEEDDGRITSLTYRIRYDKEAPHVDA